MTFRLGAGRVRSVADPRLPLAALGAAMTAAFGLILFLNRGATFTPDELAFVVTSPNLDVNDALQPYGGHLILTTRVVYKVLLETFGAGYLPFRLLVAATVVVTAGLFFVYASRRIGRLPALAPTLVLLVFGSDSLHVLAGNGFTVLMPVACGLAALLALDRGDRRGDVMACALLCLAVITYSTALAVVVGAAVAIALQGRAARRSWVVLLPVALYAGWWVWAQSHAAASSGLVLRNALVIPAWSFESLGAVMSALLGLNYHFAGAPDPAQAHPTLALATILLLVWRFRHGPVPRTVWPVLSIVLALWASQALAADTEGSVPGSPHYLYAGSVFVLLVAIELARGVRWSGSALVVIYGLAAVAVGANVVQLDNYSKDFRNSLTPQIKAALAGLDIAGAQTNPNFLFAPPAKVDPDIVNAFLNPVALGDPPTAAYLDAARRYGPFGYSPQALLAQPPGTGQFVPAITDSVLVAALRLRLQPEGRAADRRNCRTVAAPPAGAGAFPLPPGQAMLIAGATGPVSVRRFARVATTPVGVASADRPSVLRAPPDKAPDHPWYVSAAGASVRLCATA